MTEPWGGEAYIASLMDAVPVSEHVEHYARIVKACAVVRGIREKAADLEQLCANGPTPEQLQQAGADLAQMVQSSDPTGDDLVFADLKAPPVPMPAAVVGQKGRTLISSRDKVGIVGNSGDGKTHFLLGLMVGIASGRDVLGFACRQQPVLYVSSDDDPDVLRKIQRHAAGFGVELADLPIGFVYDAAFNLDTPGAVAKVRRALLRLGADKGPATLITESLTTNVSPQTTDLHDGVSVRAYIRRTLAALQAEFHDLTPVLSHHLKKPQAGGANDMSSRVSGSVQIRAGLDCVIGISADGPESFKVRTLKRSRSGAKFDPFKVTIVGDEDAPLTLRNDGTIEVSESELQGAQAAVVAFLKASGKPSLLSDLKNGIKDFRDRAIESACKKLSEGEAPLLVRSGKKPAAYAYSPPKQTPLDLAGVE